MWCGGGGVMVVVVVWWCVWCGGVVVGVARDLEQGLATKTVAQLVPGLVHLDHLALLVQGQHQLLGCLEGLGVSLLMARQQLGEVIGGD